MVDSGLKTVFKFRRRSLNGGKSRLCANLSLHGGEEMRKTSDPVVWEEVKAWPFGGSCLQAATSVVELSLLLRGTCFGERALVNKPCKRPW